MTDDRSLFSPQRNVLGAIKYHYNSAALELALGDEPVTIDTRLRFDLYDSVFWGEIRISQNWDMELEFVDVADVLLGNDDEQ